MPPRLWVFELDNTLHDARPHIFPHINRAMTAYVREQLELSEAEAHALRVRYWRRYGATLLGLVRHHGVDARDFLWRTHQFPDLATMLVFERGLAGMLRRLPGRKVVFSNAPRHYSEAVLAAMGIRHFFAAVYSIESARFVPKPSPFGFRHILRSQRVLPQQAVMVEDTLENLKTAKRLGMRTVWVSQEVGRPAFVDARIPSVLQLPRVLPKL